MLKIFSSRPTYVGEVCSETVLVKDIWLGLTSVENFDALTEVPGGLSPCD